MSLEISLSWRCEEMRRVEVWLGVILSMLSIVVVRLSVLVVVWKQRRRRSVQASFRRLKIESMSCEKEGLHQGRLCHFNFQNSESDKGLKLCLHLRSALFDWLECGECMVLR